MLFSRKVSLSDPKVLEAIESLVGQVQGDILHMLRYEVKKCQINKKNLTDLKCSLKEYLYTINDGSVECFSLSENEETLFGPVLFIEKLSNSDCRIRVYPGYEVTCNVKSLQILENLKEEFVFFQGEAVLEFKDINPAVDAVAISKKARYIWPTKNTTRVVIHYIPAVRESEDELEV